MLIRGSVKTSGPDSGKKSWSKTPVSGCPDDPSISRLPMLGPELKVYLIGAVLIAVA